jgi:MFS family permease
MLQDLYFLHERGAKMGIYMSVLPFHHCNFHKYSYHYRNAIAGGNTLGPLICGFIVSNLSWRWHKWIAVILTALNFLSVVFFVPETRYQRSDFTDSKKIDDTSPLKDDLVNADLKTTRCVSEDSHQQVPRKTYAQELSLWSGIPSTNLFKMFIRYVLCCHIAYESLS